VHITSMEPAQVRLLLSPAIVHVEALRVRGIEPSRQELSAEIQRLHDLHQCGALTTEEFSVAKQKLLGVSAGKGSRA